MSKSKSDSNASRAAAPRDMKSSRRAAGANVIVSIIAAICLLIVVNVISHYRNYRTDVQTLGQYGLSETGQAVLAEVDQRIRLTSIYTSEKKDRSRKKYFPQVDNLLEEIADAKDGVTVVNVTGDRQKGETLLRLQKRLEAKAEDHIRVIRDFSNLANTQSTQYEQMALKWSKYPPNGWLAQFGIAKQMEQAAKKVRDELRKTSSDLRNTESAVPDYAAMGEKVTDVLGTLEGLLGRISEVLTGVAELPEAAAKNRTEILQAVAVNDKVVEELVAGLGKPGDPLPKDPAKVLTNFEADAARLAEKARAAMRQLETLNQAGNGSVRYAQAWQMEEGSLPNYYGGFARAAGSLAIQANGAKANLKTEAQKDFIKDLREAVDGLARVSKLCGRNSVKLLDELTKLDKETQTILAEAAKAGYLKNLLEPVQKLAAKARELKPLEDQKELIERIGEDNIILVEVGEKTGVVTFDEVWPLAERRGPTTGDEEERRVFNGDTAVCSKILTLATEPLAEVVLTFFEQMPPPNPYMRQMQPGVTGPLPSMYLQTLRERLEKANIKITEWNLAPGPGGPPSECPEATEGRPQVLLILPPPQPTPPMGRMGQRPQPSWSPAEVERIRDAVNGGRGAIFLAAYFPPGYMGQPTPYVLSDYLEADWGLKVRSDLRVVQGEPDPLNPGKFEMPVLRWMWLPLSNFTDYPIGEPLKARRMYWLNVCPVERTEEAVTGVTYEDILVVPESPSGTWATASAEDLIEQIAVHSGGSGVEPNPEDDLLAPFAVATYAHKQADGASARVVVLGIGASFMDGYVNQGIPRITASEVLAKPEPPPTGDIDLVINSVYHLAGQDRFIGAGPTIIQPIGLITRVTMIWIKAFGLLWPVLVLGIGLIVTILRNR